MNTNSKLNSFMALGYSFLASQTPIENIPAHASEPENPVQDTAMPDEAPETKQVFQTLNVNIGSIGMRI